MLRRLWLVLVLLTIVAACGGEDEGDSNGESNELAATETPAGAVRPTLPPAATIDLNATAARRTAAPDSTVTSRPRSGPTLPPSSTPTLTPVPSSTPTSTPTLTYTPPATELPICQGFAVDSFLNRENRTRREDDEITVYWIPPTAEGNFSYLVRLYNSTEHLLWEATTTDIRYTFDSRYFFSGNIYFWQVTLLQDGVDIGCTPLDDEIIVN